MRVLRQTLLFALLSLLPSGLAAQTIQVNPNGVNVNSQDSTVVFLTFGSLLPTHVPAEGCWCGELVPAVAGVGFQCNPAKIFGCLPARYNLSTRSGAANRGFTDIMSIPPSVARRAYQAALNGDVSSFFYVRHFIDTGGGPDQYVNVTCRMAGGGPRTPFALTDVKLSFATEKLVVLSKADDAIPDLKAEIVYNGSGRLKGRWEVVLPGEELPSETDLLTEATLPVSERQKQRRYTQLGTFNILLMPGGKYTLAGPEQSRLPKTVRGQYLVLLRIEATDEKEGDSNLSAIGLGSGVVHSGAVAGFPLPVLRYYVGSGPENQPTSELTLLLPEDKALLGSENVVEFKWSEIESAAFYRLEVVDSQGRAVMSAILTRSNRSYRAPSWLNKKIGHEVARWRVVVLNRDGLVVSESAWRDLRLATLTN